jgi:hypothetical protein
LYLTAASFFVSFYGSTIIGHQRHQERGHQLDKAVIAHQGGKLAVKVALDILGVIRFERPVVGLMEHDDNGHHFAGVHLGRTQALSLTRREQGTLPVRRKLLPEIVYGTKQFEYTHERNLLEIGTGFLLCSILPGKVPYPELTLNKLFL